ncbi:UNVERIFIED_CONTAM: hypothetical protein Sradi_3584500 [Sesamum radiatum]|uniref:Uncharacterized protein n=1 Tax=Sesamum radiatum TaxID=300843 RepID=A0AAW2QGC2_SESRA
MDQAVIGLLPSQALPSWTASDGPMSIERTSMPWRSGPLVHWCEGFIYFGLGQLPVGRAHQNV